MKRSITGDPPGTPSASQGSSSGGGTSEGPASKKRIVFEPIQLGPIANLEELEVIHLVSYIRDIVFFAYALSPIFFKILPRNVSYLSHICAEILIGCPLKQIKFNMV